MTEKYRETAARLSEKYGERELLTLDEAAKILGCDRRTLLAGKALPIRKLMSRYYISVADIADFLTRDTLKRYYSR